MARKTADRTRVVPRTTATSTPPARVTRGKGFASLQGKALEQARTGAILTQEQLRDYAQPATKIRGLRSDHGLRAATAIAVAAVPLRLRKAFDPDRFKSLLASRLDREGVGYALQINDRGSCKAIAQRGYARHPADGGVRWSPATRMHVASMSKFFTAIALVRVLDRNGIGLDAYVKDRLPVHWKIGGKARYLTYRQLLSHVRGLWTGDCKYDALKREVETAGNGIGEQWHYANGNYALMRILIPILDGRLRRDVDYGRLIAPGLSLPTDQAWDVLTRLHFDEYMQQVVWRPAGVGFASLRSTRALWNLAPFSSMPHIRDAAIGYAFPPLGGGARGVDISENLADSAGAVGWHISCAEILAAAHAIRRGGRVLPAARVREMIREHLGTFATHGNPHASITYHDGCWSGSEVSEQSYLGFVGTRYDIALLSNNERVKDGRSLGNLRDTVHAAFDESFG